MANVNSAGQTHDQLQSACFVAASRLYFPYLDQRLFCIPNDMHAGNVARWKQYEALGVMPGVWDMCLHWVDELEQPYAVWTAPALITGSTHWFEFKVGKDALSSKQKLFALRMGKLGHKFYVVQEEHEFMEIIKNIVEPTLHIAKEIWKEEYDAAWMELKRTKRSNAKR